VGHKCHKCGETGKYDRVPGDIPIKYGKDEEVIKGGLQVAVVKEKQEKEAKRKAAIAAAEARRKAEEEATAKLLKEKADAEKGRLKAEEKARKEAERQAKELEKERKKVIKKLVKLGFKADEFDNTELDVLEELLYMGQATGQQGDEEVEDEPTPEKSDEEVEPEPSPPEDVFTGEDTG
jgi:hypothetical protein